MSQKQISQWRSVGFAFLVLAVLASVLLVVALEDKASAEVVSMFGSLCTFAWIATVAAFGKSLGEKTPAGEGGGLRGIVQALMGTTKGGPPPPPAAGFAWTVLLVGLATLAALVAILVAVYLSGPGPG